MFENTCRERHKSVKTTKRSLLDSTSPPDLHTTTITASTSQAHQPYSSPYLDAILADRVQRNGRLCGRFYCS